MSYPTRLVSTSLGLEIAMPDIDLDRLENEPIYAMDFQFMIGDVEDFLDFSEMNIDWQYRREMRAIERQAETEGFTDGSDRHLGQLVREDLETSAEHRFKVSLPLRVRYGVLIALTTSVEWSVRLLVKNLRNPVSRTPNGVNELLHWLREMDERTGVGKSKELRDFEALIHVRNCIAHSAGIEEHYKFRDKLPNAIAELHGFSLANWNFLGKHVCIEKGALNPYIREMSTLIVDLYRAVHEQGHLVTSTP